MKTLRHIIFALAALATSCGANDASAQAISNILIPPQTILGNLQGTHSGASALTFNELRQALSLTGILLSPPASPTPGNAIVFGAAPNSGVTVDAGAPPVLLNGAGGTPSSLTLTNATGLPVGNITGLGTGAATWLATPSSANLRATLTDETGTGAAYFQGGDIGTPSAGVGTNLTGTAAGLTAGSFSAGSASNLTSGTLPAARTNGHMNGTATNDSAAAGEVGEFLSNSAGSISLTTNVPQNGATLALPAGDWDVSCGYSASGSSTPVVSDVWISIDTTTIVPVNTAGQSFRIRGFNMTDPVLAGSVGPLRASLSGTTNYFCVMQATFSPGTFSPTALMTARRRR